MNNPYTFYAAKHNVMHFELPTNVNNGVADNEFYNFNFYHNYSNYLKISYLTKRQCPCLN